MSEIAFALDGLYAAGWWPSESDPCLQSDDDQRWYPTPSSIRAQLSRCGIDTEVSTPPEGHPTSISWSCPRYGSERVTARTETAAWLLAYTHLYPLLTGDRSVLGGQSTVSFGA
jgi:hypothetical protein